MTDLVHYVCGQCGLDTHCTVPDTTLHWSECIEPLTKEVNPDATT
jgi:hypothetical protein